MAVRIPPNHVIDRHLNDLIRFVQGLIGAWQPQLEITSWYRDPLHNQRVGGSPFSQHLIGLGLDVVGPQDELRAFTAAARSNGLTPVDEGDHVHVQLWTAASNPLRDPSFRV